MKDKLFFNRDLSWLASNARILQEAQDKTVPAAERLKFTGIFQSNLEVYITERMLPHISIMQEAEGEQKEISAKLVSKIHKKVSKQVEELNETLTAGIFPALAKKGVQIIPGENFTPEQIAFAKNVFTEKIKPHISPVFITSGTENILLENNTGYLVAEIKFHNEQGFAVIEIPSAITGRFIEFRSAAGVQYFFFAEDIIRLNLADLFPGHAIAGCYALQQVSGSDFYAIDELKEAIHELKKEKKKRDIAIFSFLFFEKGFPVHLLNKICSLLGTNENACVETERYVNLKELLKFPKLADDDLYYKPFNPIPYKFADSHSILKSIRQKDALLYFPYNSYSPVITLLEQAANDAGVLKISIVLYRVAKDSAIIKALIAAAKNGKKVFVFQEVKASENETANILYARELEATGVTVVRNFPGLKVHAKLLLITTSSEKDSCAYLGTGNFNEKTADSYADMGLFTCDERLTAEVKNIFSKLEQKSTVEEIYNNLLVSPYTMRKRLIELIDNEINFAAKGDKAHIILKLNNLEDKEIIKKLYEASDAGVEVQVIVRNICCLVPGKKKLSRNISCISIIDRFLEHGRAFYFNNGGMPEIFIGSADLMTRNLDKRIEVIFPVYDAELINEIATFLSIQLSDNVKARVIDKKQKNDYKELNDTKINEQEAVYEWLLNDRNA